MKMQKPSDAMIALFDELVPVEPGVERKPMFGQRAAWVNGNMFMGTFEERLVVRLPEDARFELAEIGGEPFEPMGRPMREYMLLPATVHDDRPLLTEWVGRAFAFVSAMPEKVKKPKAQKTPKPR